MKRFIILTSCMLACSVSFGQQSAKNTNDPAKAQRMLVASGRCALTGYFTDARNRPIAGVKTFIYQKDSSIIASGYSDSTGHYETNSVLKGAYDVKLVYPTTKAILVTAMPLKPGFNQLSLKAYPPEMDTTMPGTYFVPKPVEKKKVKK